MYHKTRALILKRQSLNKKNTYVTAYTDNAGKITYLARGLNKNEAKLQNALLPFAYSEIITVTSQGNPVITRAELIKDLYPQQSIARQILAFCIIEMIDKSSEEGLSDKRILSLVVASLNFLKTRSCNSKRMFYLLTIYFVLKLSKYLGYFPNLNHCTNCSKKIRNHDKIYLSYVAGGLLCQSCQREDGKAILLNQQERNFLKLIDKKNFNFIKNTRLSNSKLQKLSAFANSYLMYVLDIKIQSTAFLKKIIYLF